MYKYKVVSLFSGAMGLDVGLHSTGRFELLAAVEKDKASCATIRRNASKGFFGGDPLVIESDICSVEPAKLMRELGLKPGQLDLLVGGPPCQSFSTAGRRGGVSDPRGSLIWQFLRFVEIMKPKMFLMENVRGLVSASLNTRQLESGAIDSDIDETERGSVLKLFARDLQRISGARYHMDVFEVNAVNYGAPQIRERILFLGNRFNAKVDFPDPSHVNPLLVKEANIGQKSLFSTSEKAPWRTLGDALQGLDESDLQVLDFSPRKKLFLSLVPPGSNWRSLTEAMQRESMGKAWHAKGGRSGWWRRLSLDLPCPTLVTMPNHASTALCHPTETRALSVAEYARIQEFPDEWEFVGTVSEKYRQIGNAVPTRLGKVAAEVISIELDRLRQRNWRPFSERLDDYRLVYLQSHVRTRVWFRDGRAVVHGGDESSDYAPPKTLRKAKAITT